MADSAFWRDLADEFLASPDFRADGHYVIGSSGQPWTWQLAGVAADYIRSAFEALACRAASEIAGAGSPDLLIVWLEELRKGSYNFRISNQAHEVQPDGTEGPHYLMGSIHGVCKASATLCKKLEADAIQAEFEEKQRNDPKNWSQFRQQYEAFKGIRELHNEPAERIPEEFVRNAIARIHNIKPEEVTPQQISFEVAGLLSSTKRRIELIPSTARQESPPVAETQHVYVGIETTPQNQKPEDAPPSASETTASQLQRLREECRWTIEDLAEATEISARQVARHLSGEFKPLARNISAYERAFCNQLKRQVVIRKMS